MKTRQELIEFRDVLTSEFQSVGVVCKWTCETGKVIVQRNGTKKLTFSLRDERTYKDDVIKMRTILDTKLDGYKLTYSNQLGSSRPEYKVIVTLK